MKRKLLVGVLFLLLAGLVFDGCQKGATGGGPAASTPAYLNETGLPIVKSPISPRLMINMNTARGVEPAKNSVWRKLEEITGIKWEYNVVDDSAWQETLSLTWASNDLPDMFFNNVPQADLLNYSRANMILDIGPYVERYAPDFKALMETSADIHRAVTLPGGRIGSFVRGDMEISAGHGQCPPEFMTINKRWLDKLGLGMPTSAEAFFQALTAFRDRDPNGNGKKDEIGIAFWVFSGPTNGLKLLTPWFGFMTDSREIFLDGNTVKYAPFMPEYVEFLKYCNRLYREGLIDPEFFTLTSQQVVAKGSGAEDIYGAIGTSAAFLIVGPDKAPAFEATPLFVPPNGNVMWYNRNYATPGVGVISASSRYPEALVRWCNLFYTSEYRKIGWMGFEGEAYQWKTDGTWDWKFRSPADTAAAVRGELTIQGGNPGPFLCPPEWFNLAGEVEAPVNAQRVTLANTGKLRLAMPNLYYEQADLRTINTIAADLRLYESQSFAQFVTGEMNIDRDYTAFVAQLRRMDADNMVSLIQKTYDANR